MKLPAEYQAVLDRYRNYVARDKSETPVAKTLVFILEKLATLEQRTLDLPTVQSTSTVMFCGVHCANCGKPLERDFGAGYKLCPCLTEPHLTATEIELRKQIRELEGKLKDALAGEFVILETSRKYYQARLKAEAELDRLRTENAKLNSMLNFRATFFSENK